MLLASTPIFNVLFDKLLANDPNMHATAHAHPPRNRDARPQLCAQHVSTRIATGGGDPLRSHQEHQHRARRPTATACRRGVRTMLVSVALRWGWG